MFKLSNLVNTKSLSYRGIVCPYVGHYVSCCLPRMMVYDHFEMSDENLKVAHKLKRCLVLTLHCSELSDKWSSSSPVYTGSWSISRAPEFNFSFGVLWGWGLAKAHSGSRTWFGHMPLMHLKKKPFNLSISLCQYHWKSDQKCHAWKQELGNVVVKYVPHLWHQGYLCTQCLCFGVCCHQHYSCSCMPENTKTQVN